MGDEKFIVDRIEEDFIIIEDENENIITIEKNLVYGNPKEGDVLKNDGSNKYLVDIQATIDRKNKIKDLMKGLWE